MIIKTIKKKEIPTPYLKVNSKIKRALIKETVENFKRSSAKKY